MLPSATPEIVGDSAAVIGLALATITLLSTILALLWKAFKIHSDMQAVVAEMKPNHGSSMRDQVNAVRSLGEVTAQDLAKHISTSEYAIRELERTNLAQHQAIGQRIDGLFTLISGPHSAQARKVSDQHHAARKGESVAAEWDDV